MKAQSQLLEYIALSLCSSANPSSKLFMHQDGDQILTREILPRSTILDLLSLQCSSIAKGRTDVEAGDTLNKRAKMQQVRDITKRLYTLGRDM
jgi:hypothetical protein